MELRCPDPSGVGWLLGDQIIAKQQDREAAPTSWSARLLVFPEGLIG